MTQYKLGVTTRITRITRTAPAVAVGVLRCSEIVHFQHLNESPVLQCVLL
jgi:hypothetical protein